MKKPKLYIYPHAPAHAHDSIPQYVNTVPLSRDGIAKHFEIVGPEEADWFYMGQFHDRDEWLLHPNRFDYFAEKPDRHMVDLEGDRRGLEIPDFLSDSIVTAMNAYEKHRYWKVYVRPGMSHLIADILKRPREDFDVGNRQRKFVFMGQLDSMGLRARMLKALEASGVPATIQVNQQWGAQQEPQSDFVKRYEDAMRSHLFALVPCGEGISVRLLEACYFGCVPILIDDHVPFGFDHIDIRFMHRISAQANEADMARAFKSILAEECPDVRGNAAIDYFASELVKYFADPTLAFFEWGWRRGIFA